MSANKNYTIAKRIDPRKEFAWCIPRCQKAAATPAIIVATERTHSPAMEISPEVSVWALHLRRSKKIPAGKRDAGCKTGYR